MLPCDSVERPNNLELVRRIGYPALILGLVALYWGAAQTHSHAVNTEMSKADQSAYLAYGRNMASTDYGWVGGRNQMPIFAFLVSTVDRPGLTMDQLFTRAKVMNTALSLAVLFGIFLLLRRSLPGLEAATLSLIVAFTIYVYRAAYVQAELLFYGLFFLSFFLVLRYLERPTAGLAALIGGASGIAYLTKASLLPLLAAFVLFAVLGIFAAESGSGPRGAQARIRSLGIALLAIGCFVLTVFPYISTSKARFGQWFYNVNSSIYIWADSWDEVQTTMSGTGDREHWPDLPPDVLPSPSRYLREHSFGQMTERITRGIWISELRHLGRNFGYGKYLILYSIVVAAVMLTTRRKLFELFVADRRWLQTGYAVTVVVGYLLAIAFYSPIVRGPRLVLALYLPTMYCYFWFLSRDSIRSAVLGSAFGFEFGPRHIHMTSLVILAYDVIIRLPGIIRSDFAGA